MMRIPSDVSTSELAANTARLLGPTGNLRSLIISRTRLTEWLAAALEMTRTMLNRCSRLGGVTP